MRIQIINYLRKVKFVVRNILLSALYCYLPWFGKVFLIKVIF